MTDNKTKLLRTTIILHWIIGISILVLIPMGIYMIEVEDYDLYAIHSSIGTVLFLLVLFQVIGRIKKGWLPSLSNKNSTKQKFAKFIKLILFITALLFPISGVIMSVAGGSGLYIFGIELVSANVNPQNVYEMIPLNEDLAYVGSLLHVISEYIMIVAIFAHIIGALMSHFIDKEDYLNRMLGKQIK